MFTFLKIQEWMAVAANACDLGGGERGVMEGRAAIFVRQSRDQGREVTDL